MLQQDASNLDPRPVAGNFNQTNPIIRSFSYGQPSHPGPYGQPPPVSVVSQGYGPPGYGSPPPLLSYSQPPLPGYGQSPFPGYGHTPIRASCRVEYRAGERRHDGGRGRAQRRLRSPVVLDLVVDWNRYMQGTDVTEVIRGHA